jgi:hypothetical protein
VGKIIYLRQNYHFGPLKIAMYLRRYHQITISKSGVWRILKKFYQFTAIDDYTAARLPFKNERVQTDNGTEFQSAFHLHLLDQGVEHIPHNQWPTFRRASTLTSCPRSSETLYITTFGLLLGSLFGLGLAMMLVKILTGVGMVLALRRAR